MRHGKKLRKCFKLSRTLPYYMALLNQMKQKPHEFTTNWGARVEGVISKALDSANWINNQRE